MAAYAKAACDETPAARMVKETLDVALAVRLWCCHQLQALYAVLMSLTAWLWVLHGSQWLFAEQ